MCILIIPKPMLTWLLFQKIPPNVWPMRSFHSGGCVLAHAHTRLLSIICLRAMYTGGNIKFSLIIFMQNHDKSLIQRSILKEKLLQIQNIYSFYGVSTCEIQIINVFRRHPSKFFYYRPWSWTPFYIYKSILTASIVNKKRCKRPWILAKWILCM